MSDVPPVGTPLGDLVIDEIFIDYDGPKLFTCVDSYGSFYLAVFVDEDYDFELYLYAEISPTRLDALRTGQLAFREAFEKPHGGNVWVVRRSLGVAEGAADRVSPEDIAADWLPSEGARLSVETPSVPVPHEDSSGTIASLIRTFGAPDSIQIQLSAMTQAQVAQRVSVSIRIRGVEVNPFDSLAEDVDVRSVEVGKILHDLARLWPFIEWEESSPWGRHAKSFTELTEFVRDDEGAVSLDLQRKRKEENGEFVRRHNLGRIFWGEQAVSLIAFREAGSFHLLSPRESWKLPAAELLDLLEKLGDALVNRLRESAAAESAAAVDAWRKKRSLRSLRVAEIATGISSGELRLVEQALGDSSVWISPDDPASNELYAAARMSAGLSVEEIAQIVGAVSSAPKTTTQKLDALSREAARVVAVALLKFETGYGLAEWYRRYLKVTRIEAVDPEQCLRSLGVQVRDVALSSVVDAVAVWGPRHGPCVIVNSKGYHSSSPGGRRITLAHELGHMLLDRTGSLPLAEVLGGRLINESVEVRARAFAAELLLPRETAESAYAASPDSPEGVVASLVADYGVSREVAAWQIRNSAARLTAQGRSILRSYVRTPGSF